MVVLSWAKSIHPTLFIFYLCTSKYWHFISIFSIGLTSKNIRITEFAQNQIYFVKFFSTSIETNFYLSLVDKLNTSARPDRIISFVKIRKIARSVRLNCACLPKYAPPSWPLVSKAEWKKLSGFIGIVRLGDLSP